MPNNNTMLVIEAGVELLDRVLETGGVAAWNEWIERLFDLNIVCTTWSEIKPPPPVTLGMDFSTADLSARKLDGIDFRFAWMVQANLKHSSLQRAKLGSVAFT